MCSVRSRSDRWVRRRSTLATRLPSAGVRATHSSMARFERSLKLPMGDWTQGMRATSSFASTTQQRAVTRSWTGRAGPGFYNVQLPNSFARYEGPPASPKQRQPLRMLPTSANLRLASTRFVSTAPRIADQNPWSRAYPGPGHYSLEQYSQFSPLQATRRIQPFAMQAERSSIRDVFPDRRNAIICRPESTPAPNRYSPVPDLDKLRMSMPNPPCGLERIRPTRGITLEKHLASNSNLFSTMKRLR